MKRFLKYSLFFILLLLLILLGSIGGIVGTESGLRLLVEQTQEWGPGELKIDTLEGRLIDDLSITGLSYQLDETAVKVDSFQLAWDAEPLLDGRMHIKKLHIDGVEVNLPATGKKQPEEKSAPLEIPDIKLPMQFAIDEAKIAKVTINIPGAEPFIIENIQLQSTTTDVLSLQHLLVESPLFNAKITGNVGLTAPHAVQLDLDWQAKLPEFTVVGQGKLSGDTEKLTLTHTVSEPLEIDLKATVKDVLGALDMDVALTWQEIYWPFNSQAKDHLVNSQQGRANLSGTLDNYHFDLTAKVKGNQIPAGHWTISARGNQQQVTIEKLRSEILKGFITAKGQVSWKPKLVAQLELDTDKITIKDFWKEWPDQLRIKSHLEAQLDDKDFEIKQLKVSLPQTTAQLSLQGKGTLAGEKTLLKRATLEWQGVQWPLVGKNPLATSKKGKVKVAGTPQNYRVNLDTRLAGAQIPPGHLTLTGRGNLKQFTLASLRTDILEGVVNATGQVSWQPKLVARLKLNADKITIKDFWKEWPDQLRIKSHLTARLDGQDFEIKQLKVSLPKTPAQLSLQGKGSLAGETPRFETTLVWQGLQWPLVGSPSLVNTPKGTLRASGTPNAYQLRLNADINGKDIPAGHWQANGAGDSTHLTLKSLQGKILEGRLDLAGKVRWKPDINWQLTLKGNKINPGSQYPEWPGKIALNIQSQGSLKNGKLNTQVKVKHVKGKLRDYPLLLKTEVTVKNNNYYKIKGLDFKSGKTRLTVNGSLGQRSNLNWVIKAPDLASLLPEAQGHLFGKGRVTGSLNAPRLTAKLIGNSLNFQDKKLKYLKANVDVNLRTKKNLLLDIVAKNFKQGTTDIEEISLKGKGSFTKHSLTARMTLPSDSILLKVRGGFFEPRWRGQLQQLTASTEKFGKWRLQKPTLLILSAEEAQLSRSCLRNAQRAKVCTQLHWQKTADTKVQMNLSNISLALLDTLLPEGSNLTGIINGRLAGTLRPDQTIKSDVAIRLSSGAFKVLINDELSQFSHKGGTINLQIAKTGLAAKVNFGLLDTSRIDGTFRMPGFTRLPLNNEQAIKGRIKANADLSILPTFVPQVENTKGKVKVDMKVGGTLTAPQIQGYVQLQKAATNLPDLGLDIKDLGVNIRSKGQDGLTLQGSLKSGDGQLKLNGGVKKLWSATDREVNLNIAGKNFEVVNIPDAWGLASPNINVKMLQNSIDVRGEITIPKLVITPSTAGGGSGSIAASQDVIIVNPNNPKPEKKDKTSTGIVISSHVTIHLGNDVSFEGSGFKSHFGGTVVASNKPGEITVGNGELQIIKGRYKAYGQDLKIDKGRVFFSGGPIENPGLDIKAYRRIKRRNEDPEVVIAGMHIQGLAQSPKLVLYSEPTLDQTNTLSYIILGKPAANATQGEGNILLTAATALPFKYGDDLAKSMGKEFGLEAGISTDEGIEKAALVVGKYLTPGLYISYGIGLFDGNAVLRMRYELTKRLMLETETGTQSGVDLRYTLER